ncbi:MAG: methyl-accepting chemotaxis protein, partial [Sulfurospirillaceae bacterium]|nr:methyl-accepting chemotaxis protein [Sulfurospirillaceae bacterium]
MILHTIKGKLTLLLTVLIIGVSFLGYQMVNMGKNAEMTATRLVSVGKLEALFLKLRMEQRNYQIYFMEEALAEYKKYRHELELQIDFLSSVLHDSENKKRVLVLKQDIQKWANENDPQKIVDSGYTQSYNDNANSNTKTLSPFDLILKQVQELSENVSRVNLSYLAKNEHTAEVILACVSIFVLIVFVLVTQSIKASVNQAREGCEIMRSTKDLSTHIKTDTKDEINHIIQAVNTLITEVARALGEAKQNALENASVAEELSSTSLQIGKRVEEEAQIVFQTQSDAQSVATEIQEASTQANKV